MSSWRFGDDQHSLSLSCYFILCLPLCWACLCSEVFPQKLRWWEYVQAAICRWSRSEWNFCGKTELWECLTPIEGPALAQEVWNLAEWKWKKGLVVRCIGLEAHYPEMVQTIGTGIVHGLRLWLKEWLFHVYWLFVFVQLSGQLTRIRVVCTTA